MNGQMKKGILEMCILSIVAQQETYGYEILKRVSAHFSDIDESTIYAILRRLYSDEIVSAKTVSIGNTPARKYYSVTGRGRIYLSECIDNWRKVNAAVTDILGNSL